MRRATSRTQQWMRGLNRETSWFSLRLSPRSFRFKVNKLKTHTKTSLTKSFDRTWKSNQQEQCYANKKSFGDLAWKESFRAYYTISDEAFNELEAKEPQWGRPQAWARENRQRELWHGEASTQGVSKTKTHFVVHSKRLYNINPW
jgi:hypothetical protein